MLDFYNLITLDFRNKILMESRKILEELGIVNNDKCINCK